MSHLKCLANTTTFHSTIYDSTHCASKVFSSCRNKTSEYKEAARGAFCSWHHGQCYMYSGPRVHNTTFKDDTNLLKFKMSSYFHTFLGGCFSFVGFLLCCSLVDYCIHVFNDDILKVSHTVKARISLHQYV